MQKDNKHKLSLTSLILGLLFLGLSFFVNKDVFRSIDYNALVAFQNTFGRSVDLPFSLLTLLGSSEVILTAVVIIFFLIFWLKKYLFIEIFLIFAIYVFELLGKILIYHPKPPVGFNRYVLDIFFPSSFIVETQYSFPSGHMARTTFLTIIILYLVTSLFKKKINSLLIYGLCVLFISLIFISRIYLAEHWLSDVVGGLLLGGSLATFTLSIGDYAKLK